MQECYFRLGITNISDEQNDSLSEDCFAYGAAGVTENLEYDQSPETYEVTTLSTETHKIDVYFLKPPTEDFFLLLQSKYPDIEYKLFSEENKDWMEEWKKGFEAFPLVDDIWVVPSWKPVPKEAGQVLKIDPGMAFGTGTHSTTQLAARLIKKHVKPSDRILDVGAGTGVLSLVCGLLGASAIQATEIDEMARKVARENIEKNRASVIVHEHQVENISEEFDVVIANIIDGVLLKLSANLRARTRKGGLLILTGILNERSQVFLEKFIINGDVQLIEQISQGEWTGMVLRK